MTERVHIIGAGMGGLASAIRLAAAGCTVEVFEAASHPGGKAGFVELEGVRVDTGPSVLTLPEVFDDLFQAAGEDRADYLEWIQPDPAFAYKWRTGETLWVYSELERTLESVRTVLGAQAADDLSSFMRYARRIWDASSEDFVYGPQVSWRRILGLPPKKWYAMTQIDALSKMSTAIRKRVRSPAVAGCTYAVRHLQRLGPANSAGHIQLYRTCRTRLGWVWCKGRDLCPYGSRVCIGEAAGCDLSLQDTCAENRDS